MFCIRHSIDMLVMPSFFALDTADLMLALISSRNCSIFVIALHWVGVVEHDGANVTPIPKQDHYQIDSVAQELIRSVF